MGAGLIPVAVSDHWSFVLDVLFCGVTLAGLRPSPPHQHALLEDRQADSAGCSAPIRSAPSDAIGAKGADFLTWSCLHHLAEVYGDLFRPTPELIERKDTGQAWYPPDHLRPVVDWTLTEAEHEAFRVAILGPLFQMTSLHAPRAARASRRS